MHSLEHLAYGVKKDYTQMPPSTPRRSPRALMENRAVPPREVAFKDWVVHICNAFICSAELKEEGLLQEQPIGPV